MKQELILKSIPAGFYNGAIWFLSSQPININLTGFDKTAHIVEYSILGFLLSIACSISEENFNIKAKYAVFLGILAGLTDEIHQYFVPGRAADIIDLIADAVGISIGILIWFYLSKNYIRLKSTKFKN